MPFIIGVAPSESSSGGTIPPEQLEQINTNKSKIEQQDSTLASIQTKDSQQDAAISAVDSKVDSAAANTLALSERVNELETNLVDYGPDIQAIQAKDIAQDTLIVTATAKNDAQDIRLDSIEAANSDYESRISTTEAAIPNKADLVGGKIPINQLPDLPVGRKVSVADDVERLALPIHPDLTIAYQVDTADAWVLDSNEDPSVEDNWDKLGNADAVGVQAFNGRTGNVTPQSGDYTAAMITPTQDLGFISPNDRTRWDDKATTASVVASTSALRSEVEAAYLKTNQKAVVNGVASLGADGKVPLAQLPPLGLTAAQSQRIDQVESNTSLANAKGDSAAVNILAVDTRLSQVDTDSKSRDTAQNVRLAALEARPTNFIPLTQKASANGVAPLDAASKVPIVNLPTFLPQRARIWRDNKRAYNTWVVNDSDGEMVVFVRTNAITDVATYVLINMRADSGSTTLAFASPVEPMPAGNRYITHQATVPAGWQFAVTIAGGGTYTIANIGVWRELS